MRLRDGYDGAWPANLSLPEMAGQYAAARAFRAAKSNAPCLSPQKSSKMGPSLSGLRHVSKESVYA
jgi:hypothetical protein